MENSFYGIYYKFQWSSGDAVAVIASDKAIQIMYEDQVYISAYSEKVQCSFDSGSLNFSVTDGAFEARADIRFLHNDPLHYDIMGPFRFAPDIVCKHKVYSMESCALGSMRIGGVSYRLSEARVYVEGDRGRSFPERYLWIHCFLPKGSLMLAVAQLQVLKKNFTGVIGLVQEGERQYRLATYLGARARIAGPGTVIVTQRRFRLTVTVHKNRSAAFRLLAPKNGKMTDTIKECLSGDADIAFQKGSRTVIDAAAVNSSFEWVRL
jgi:hypothetical protein